MMHAWVQVRRQQPIACVIHNLSNDGALVEFVGFAPTVNRLKLIVDYKDLAVDCEVRHRRSNALGLEFRISNDTHLALPRLTGTELVYERRALFRGVPE